MTSTTYMSNNTRDVIFSEQTKCRNAPKHRKGLVDDINDVIDLNQRKLDSGLSKLSSHDLAYKQGTAPTARSTLLTLSSRAVHAALVALPGKQCYRQDDANKNLDGELQLCTRAAAMMASQVHSRRCGWHCAGHPEGQASSRSLALLIALVRRVQCAGGEG